MKIYPVILIIFTLLSAKIYAQDWAASGSELTSNLPLTSSMIKEIRILSWNIQMLPRLLLPVRRGPIKRARLIPEKIINDSIDIIVFQECFDNRARRILKRRLKNTYPYKVGPANRMLPVFFTNSGIVIYSKFPITDKWSFAYKWREKQGHDKFARKGCLLVEIVLPGDNKIQVLGTHLQAGGPDKIRHSQYKQLRSFIDQHRKENVPQIICGDFNTRQNDEINYKTMLATIDADDGEIMGDLCYTSDGLLNDMKSPDSNDRKVIDYIFYRGNGIEPQYLKREVRQYEQRWSHKHKDLSDHNAVLGKLKF
jgi:endonuclease/exonuclease/phosphatase family metal-dependent hydrolase